MKKLLMIYASKTGTTKKCVDLLLAGFEGYAQVQVITTKQSIPPLDEFDGVMIGSPIRMGRFHKEIAKFLKLYHKKKKNNRLYLFVCCGSDETLDKYIRENVPHELMPQVKLYQSLGGEYCLSASKGIEKKIIESVMKSYINEQKPMPKIQSERIAAFCEAVKEDLDTVETLPEENAEAEEASEQKESE